MMPEGADGPPRSGPPSPTRYGRQCFAARAPRRALRIQLQWGNQRVAGPTACGCAVLTPWRPASAGAATNPANMAAITKQMTFIVCLSPGKPRSRVKAPPAAPCHDLSYMSKRAVILDSASFITLDTSPSIFGLTKSKYAAEGRRRT